MSSTTIHHCIQYTNPQEQQLKMCFNFHHLKVDYKNGDKWSLMPCDFMGLKRYFTPGRAVWQKAAAGMPYSGVTMTSRGPYRGFGDDTKYRKQSAKMLATAIHGMRRDAVYLSGEELGMTNAGFTSASQYRDVESLHYFDILKESGIDEAEVFEILRQRSRDNSRTPCSGVMV